MSICAGNFWTMRLAKEGSTDPVTLTFKDVKVVNQVLTGIVDDGKGNTSDLSGTCSPFDSRENVVRMDFFFRAMGPRGDVYVFLSGLGLQPLTGNPVFHGGFAGLPPPASPRALPVEVNFDVGETGTGNGMQAMLE